MQGTTLIFRLRQKLKKSIKSKKLSRKSISISKFIRNIQIYVNKCNYWPRIEPFSLGSAFFHLPMTLTEIFCDAPEHSVSQCYCLRSSHWLRAFFIRISVKTLKISSIALRMRSIRYQASDPHFTRWLLHTSCGIRSEICLTKFKGSMMVCTFWVNAQSNAITLVWT